MMSAGSQPEADRLRRLLHAEALTRYTLENGLTVLHSEERSAELVSVQLWVKTGSIHEGIHLGSGLSHYLEHLLFKGTERRADGDIAREVQENGGYINAYTTFDRTVYYLDLPAEKLPFALDLLADMAFHARLDEQEILREREVILREIAMGEDDPDQQLGRAAFRNAFKTHPYRFPVIGEKALFSQVQPDGLRSYYHARYLPGNMALIVVGAVDEAGLREEVANTFGRIHARPVAPVWFPPEPPQLAQRTERLRQDLEVCRGILAYRIPHLAHPDAIGLNLLSTILGQGQSSLLWQAMREERELVHHISAATWNPGEAGLFWISYLCEPAQREVVETAIQAFLAETAQGGISEADLAKARRLALVREVNARKTMSGQAARLGQAEVVLGDVGYPEAYLRAIESVKAENLSRLIVRYLHPDRLTQVSLNAEDAVPAKVSVAAEPLADFQLRTLSNGARLLWQRDPRLPKVHLRLSGLGGAFYEAPDKRGVTTLMTTLLTRDSRWRRSADVARAVESVGGSFQDHTGNNTFALTMEVLSGDLGLAREILEEGVFSPQWRESTFAREKASQLSELKEVRDDIVELGHDRIRRHFFGDFPLAIEPTGDPETVARLSVDDLRLQYDRLLVASNMVLTVVGDFDPECDLRPLEAFLLDLPDWAFRSADRAFEGPVAGDHRETLSREQTVVFLAYPDVGAAADEDLAGQVLDAICSDMSSELFKQVREDRGLAYFVSTTRTLGIHAGQFTFYAGTQPESAAEVLAALRTEARRLRENGPTQAELDRARQRLKAQLRMSQQSPGSRAAHVSLNAHFGRPINDWHDYDERLDAITVDDLKHFATRFRDDQAVSLMIGPESSEAD